MKYSRLVGAGLPLVTASWLLALVSAPALALRPTGRPLAATVFAAGSIVCHQLADRSFHVGLLQLPVCARCLGLYVGAALGALADSIAGWRLGASSRRAWRGVLAGAALPTVATLALEWTAGADISNGLRFGSAIPLGVAILFFVAAVARGHLR